MLHIPRVQAGSTSILLNHLIKNAQSVIVRNELSPAEAPSPLNQTSAPPSYLPPVDNLAKHTRSNKASPTGIFYGYFKIDIFSCVCRFHSVSPAGDNDCFIFGF